MQVPLEIVFHNVDRSPAVEAAVRERAAKLERFADDITSCRVTVEAPHKNHQQGNLYSVRVDLRFPGGEAVVNRSPGDDHAHDTLEAAARRELIEETGWEPGQVDVLLIGPTSSGMSNERIAFVRARKLKKVGDGGGVDNEDIVVHAVPRHEAPAWLMRKQAEGYELDLKLWAGLWMLEHNPDGTRLED